MPAVRLTRRRRSSLASSAKATYSFPRTSARPVTFASNLTPVTFTADSDNEDADGENEESSVSGESSPPPAPSMFPPSLLPAPPPTRRRAPPGKRRSQGYIPRPPNAFMLFRADFVRQKHVPGTIETAHGSLSKIIGETWQLLEPADKHVWEAMAKNAKAEHKKQYPDYRFKPVHNKNKKEKDGNAKSTSAKSRKKTAVTESEEARCGAVAGLLVNGYRGETLAAAVRDLDAQMQASGSGSSSPSTQPAPRNDVVPTTQYLPPPPQQQPRRDVRGLRRSSSVPPINNNSSSFTSYNNNHADMFNNFGGYAPDMMSLPIHAPQSHSRPASPMGGVSSRMSFGYGLRRSSSARPANEYAGQWGFEYALPQYDQHMPMSMYYEHDGGGVLPPLYDAEPDTSLFDPNFSVQSQSYQPQQQAQSQYCADQLPQTIYDFNDILTSLPPQSRMPPQALNLECIGPMDSVAPHQLSLSPDHHQHQHYHHHHHQQHHEQQQQQNYQYAHSASTSSSNSTPLSTSSLSLASYPSAYTDTSTYLSHPPSPTTFDGTDIVAPQPMNVIGTVYDWKEHDLGFNAGALDLDHASPSLSSSSFEDENPFSGGYDMGFQHHDQEEEAVVVSADSTIT